MIDCNDFINKQIIIVNCNQGEKLCYLNDNIVIKNSENKIIHQSTCYRLFAVYIIGHTTITTGLIEKTRKFGFSIVLLSTTFRIHEIIGSKKDSNFLLHKAQYEYNSLELAKHIINNKIINQYKLLMKQRDRSSEYKQVCELIKDCSEKVYKCNTLQDIMGYEGNVSRMYFRKFFNNVQWIGRKPRIKYDYINTLLDIGYTVLFNYIEILLNIYGFDTYYGVMHRCFYMRKSLVCDIIEPFRVIIDKQIKKSISLRQFKEEDFIKRKGRIELKWEKSSDYIAILLNSILEYKIDIFIFVRDYYRAFMKGSEINSFPKFIYK